MTCITGATKDGKVWLGSDSVADDGWHQYAISAGSKLFELDAGSSKITFGYTTSFRFAQLIEHNLTLPDDRKHYDPQAYLIGEVIPAIRSTLSDGGWLRKKDEREDGGSALIGYRGRLFVLQDDLSVLEPGLPYFAVGSGASLALGAMHFADSVGRKPESVVLAGLKAAADLDPHVLPPFDTRRCK